MKLWEWMGGWGQKTEEESPLHLRRGRSKYRKRGRSPRAVVRRRVSGKRYDRQHDLRGPGAVVIHRLPRYADAFG